MTNPINLQIKRADNTWDIIEAAPVLIEEGHDLKPTGSFQLYRGYPEFDSNLFDADEMRERYMESLQLTGEENPGYLGELHFTGLGYFEWKYDGSYLRESEVIQIVDCIQEYAAGRKPVTANGIILQSPEPPSEVPLSFQYGKNRITYQIRIEELEGHFVVFINNELTAQIELTDYDWEVTGGDIIDPDLKAEVIRRISANC